VGGVLSLHQCGHSLTKVQVVQVTRSHTLWRGHTCVDLYLKEQENGSQFALINDSQFMVYETANNARECCIHDCNVADNFYQQLLFGQTDKYCN
jgi:hypothetical protein